ncbi:hypothetical protein FBULB1_13206, partial [Fusarium bulbicola]
SGVFLLLEGGLRAGARKRLAQVSIYGAAENCAATLR